MNSTQDVSSAPIETLRNTAAEIIHVVNECNVIADEIEAKLLFPYPQEECQKVKEADTDSLEGQLNLIRQRARTLDSTLVKIHQKS